MDAYFILRVRIQIQFLNSVLKLFWLWLLGALSIAALPFRFTPNHCSFFFFFFKSLSYFLALQEAPGSSCLLSAQVLESAFSKHPPPRHPALARSPGFFYWKIVLEMKGWALGLSSLMYISCTCFILPTAL